MYRTYSCEIGQKPFSVEIGRLAELANGAAVVRYGDTVLICTATASEKPRAGIDFFPLSTDYEERLYSVGKIPGGFIKREGKPTEKAVLTSRLIDRPLRPLFPSDYRNDVSVVSTVLCVDQDCSPEMAAMIGSSIALSISDIPFGGPTAAVNVGIIDGKFVVNPDSKNREDNALSLTVASTKDKVMMIEAGADEIDNDTMFDAIMFAHAENQKIIKFIEEIVAKEGKPKHSYERHLVNPEVLEKVKELVDEKQMEEAVFTDMKQVRDEKMREMKDFLLATLSEQMQDASEDLATDIADAVYQYEKKTVRRMIFKDHKRPDGRKLDEIRALSAEIDFLPRTHGSAVFKRGQTQVLTIATLGSVGESQRLDGLDELEESKRYMHHYNFPSYSVGETRPSRGPGRREIGHGALAERALLPVIPSEAEFPYAIRLVSEVVSSNGSTSQASVCASSLSLMAAGVPIKAPVAGISVGLVTDPNPDSDEFVLLTDIQGLEDFFGDMDFKVAGTHKGITAIQMDIKIDGLTPEIIRKSLDQTFEARKFILDGVMASAISEPRKELSAYAPKIAFVTIKPEKMSEVIGSRGKVINRIIDESGVTKIDTEDDGRIFIAAHTSEAIQKAMDMILAIAEDPVIGKIYKGKVTGIKTFGAFVEIAPEKEGLCHISNIAKERIKQVEDVLQLGDEILVKVIGIDEQGKISLSRKAALVPEGTSEEN